MSWELLIDAAGGLVELAANWWIQSFVLLGAGLALGALCQRRGSAVQSAIYRTTLVAVIAAPAASWLLARAGWTGWSITMPEAWTTAAAEPSPSALLSLPAALPEADDQRAAADLIASSPTPPLTFAERNGDGDGFEPENSYPTDPIHGGHAALAPAIASPPSPASLPSMPAPGDATPVATVSPFGVVAAVASGLWIVVGLFRLVRVAVAWRRLSRIRRQAVPAEDEAQHVCREIAGRLAVAAPAVLRSPYLPSPCLSGLRRPAVLLPEAAGHLPVRDVLAHELAHLRRRDCHWNLARQLAGAVLFFQPLMGRLSRRLEATAEEVCDDYVVHLGGDRRNYAHRLCDIAELSQAPFAAAGVGIVSLRSMLGQRVARIMDTSRSLSTRVGGALLALVLVGGLLGTLAAGLVGLGANATQAEPTVEEPTSESAIESPGADQGAGDQAETEAKHKHIVGRVVGPDGKPVANATVLAAWVVPLGEPPTERHEHRIVGQVRSDAHGRFELDFSTERPAGAGITYGWHIVAFKAGLGPAWRRDVHLLKDPSPTLRLTSDVPIRGRLLDLEGRPVAGATVRIRALAPTQTEEAIAQWIKESQEKPIPDPMEDSFYNSGDERFAGRFPTTTDDGGLASGSPALPVDVRTGDDGRFEFVGIGGNRLTMLEIEGPMIAKTRFPAVTRDMEPFAARALHVTPAHNGMFYGRAFDFVVGPTQAIVGTVTDAETGQPLADMEIRVGRLAGNRLSLTDFLATKTDAEGRYRLVGAPAGGGHRIDVAPAVDEPYFPQHVEMPVTAADQEDIVCDLSLRQGHWIEGRITASDDGAPVEGATIQFLPLRSNKHAVDYSYFDPKITGSAPSDRFKTAADGSFRVLAIPGEGILMGIARWEDRETFCALGLDGAPKHLLGERGEPLTYLPWTLNGVHVVHELDIDAEAETSTCNLEFTRGLKRAVKLVDAAGLPAVGVRVLGRVFPPSFEKPLVDSTATITGLRLGAERDVVFIHPERRIGKALNLAAGDETTITLEPCAIARGRVVDEDGAPLAGVSVGVTIDHPDNWHRGLLQSVTDADGRFEALLPPGTVCRVSHYSMSGPNFSAVCEATPGAVFELGDLADGVKLLTEQTAKLMVAAPKESVEEPLVSDSPSANHEVSTQPLSYSGRVETPQGEPIAGAKIWLAVTSHKYVSESNRENGEGLLRELGAADEQGRFEIVLDAATTQEIRKRLHFSQAQLAATAEGRGLDWLPLDVFEDNPAPSEKRDMLQARIDQALGDGRFASRALKLRPESQPVRGRLVDLEGHRLPNVTVRVESLRQPDVPRLLTAFEKLWKRELNEAFSATSVGELARSELQKLIPPVTTDDNGEFELRGIGDDQLVTLVFDADRVEARPLYVLGREMETVSLPHMESYLGGAKDVFVGRDFTFAVGPSVPVEGVVTDYDTGEPVANVLVYVERLFKKEGVENVQLRLDTHHMRGGTDERGRFRINGMPPGEGHVVEFLPPRSEPYFPASQDVSLSLKDGDAKRIEIRVKRGIWIEGRVTDKQSGEPLLATVDYLALRKNPHSLDKLGLDLAWVEKRYGTDSDGRYRVPGLPGPGVLLVTSQVSGYPLAAGAETIDGYDASGGVIPTTPFPLRLQFSDWRLLKQIDPAADAISSHCDLALDAGVTIPGRVVGPDGKPISDFYVLGQTERETFWGPRNADNTRSTTDRIAVNGYDGKGPRQLFFKNQDETLVGQYRLEGDAPEEIVVTLQPSVRVTGRLIENETDLPAARYFLLCEECTLSNEEYPPVKFRIHWRHTDDEGRFEIKGLMAGLAYKMNALNESNLADDRNRFTIDLTAAKPGDVIELGDVTGLDSEGEAFAAAAEDAATPAAAAVAAPAESAPTASEIASDDLLELAGSVITSDGKPAADADLYLVFYIPQPAGLLTPSWKPIGRTDAKGEFQLAVNPRDFGVGVRRAEAVASALVAVKEGFGFAFAPSGLYEKSGSWREMIQAKLSETPTELLGSLQRMLAGAGEPLRLTVDDAPLRGRVIDVDGQPVAGVRFTLLEIWTGADNDLTAWRNAAQEEKADYYSARMQTPLSMNGPQVRSLVQPASTDAEGRFTMRGIGRGRIAELLVEGPGVESARVFARTEAGEPIVLPRERRWPDLGEYTYHSAEFTLVAGPSVPIEGVVRDAATKQPLAGVTVKSQARHGEMINGWGQDFVRAVTDDEGRYRLTGLPVGDGNRIAAIAPRDAPYFSMSARAATRGDQQSLEVDFDLPRGVWIEGRVTDKQTGRGLAGQLEYHVSRESEHYALARSFNVDERDRLQADDEGRFRIAGLPGPGYVSFMAFDHQDYPRASSILGVDGPPKAPGEPMLQTAPSILMLANNHAVAEVNPAADVERYELNIRLDGGKLVGHVVDDAGNPVTGFRYSGRIAAFGVW